MPAPAEEALMPAYVITYLEVTDPEAFQTSRCAVSRDTR